MSQIESDGAADRELVDLEAVANQCTSLYVCALAQRTHAKRMRERAATMAVTAVGMRSLITLTRAKLVSATSPRPRVSEAGQRLLAALTRASPLCLSCAAGGTRLNKWDVCRALLDLIRARTALASPATRCARCGETALTAMLL